jgi:hypothetical protein
MKTSTKARARAPKRDLFAELSEGMRALAKARHGKRALRTHVVVSETDKLQTKSSRTRRRSWGDFGD